MSGKNNFIGKAISLVMDCDKMVGPYFEQGLAIIKQIVETVVSNKAAAFREVALVEYPRKGAWTLCFLTGKTIDQPNQVFE